MDKINGTTPQDLNKLNTNLLKIAKKLFNKFKLTDLDYDLQQRIKVHEIPISGVGNFDNNSNYILYFYIDADKYNIKGGEFNFINSKYRVDVDTEKDGSTSTSSNGSGNIMTEPGNPTEEHRHSVVISAHTHTVLDHKHELVKKITLNSSLSSVTITLNGKTVSTISASETEKNGIDVTKSLKEGWNSMVCSTSSLARITIYGIIELEKK